MRKIVSIILLFSISILLSSCGIVINAPGRDLCNPKLTLSKEEIEYDINNNKQEYYDMINLLTEYYIRSLTYHKEDSEELINTIKIYIYTGNDEEVFKLGNYPIDQVDTYQLTDFDEMKQEDKNIIKTFIENRQSKEITIYYENNQIEFYFFSLTYIVYDNANNEFTIKTEPCPNG